MVGKRVQFDDETWQAIVALADRSRGANRRGFRGPPQEAQAAGGA